jgi:transglutaminase-like putative cysteine protease
MTPAPGLAPSLAPSGRLAQLRRLATQQLPRDARDTLFLLGVIGLVLLPHLPQRPAWCAALAIGLVAWRAALVLAGAPLPGRLPVVGVLVLAAGLTWWSEGSLLGREPGVTMLVVLMALKTLELRARRDAMVTLLLGFFLVLTQFLYAQSVAVAVGALLATWGLMTALALAQLPGPRPPLRRAAGVAGRAALLAAPAMVVLFLFFPRIGPLWGLPQDASGRTGLSGTLRLGEMAEIAQDDSVAMRVRFLGQAPPLDALYFRGPVLTAFDGREWTRSPRRSSLFGPGTPVVEHTGQPVDYEVTLEPSALAVLPLLELTLNRPGEAPSLEDRPLEQQADLVWTIGWPLAERARFSARAWPEHRHGWLGSALALREHVALPPGYNPRALEWAAALRREPRYATAHADVLVGALMQHLRAQGFRYTLEPGTYGRHAVDEFWFDRREGFCEHFAAAFVVMLRALDVPARIVTGYQGADPTPVDGWWTVRRSHAHAWAEYWDGERGWVRVDPTSAAAPDRIGRSRQLTAPRGLVASTLDQLSPGLLTRVRQLAEAWENRWNQYVLNYSRGRQFELLRTLGFSTPSGEDLLRVLGAVVVVVGVAGAAAAALGRRRADPWQRLQQRVAVQLGRLGVRVAASDPPRARAQKVRAALGGRGEALAQALEVLERLRYAPVEGGGATPGRPPRQWWPAFQRAAREAGGSGA